MYRIIKDGTTLGFTESPNYVSELPNGCWGLTDEPYATGIAWEGNVYALSKESVTGDLELVTLLEIDSGAVTNEQAAALKAVTEELTSTQLALCDVYEQLVGGTANG